MYSKRVWLNKNDSPSTGNMVAFDGDIQWRDETVRSTFLQISDCGVSARLHKADNDKIEDFIDKIELLKNEVQLFIDYLKKEYEK